MPAAAVASFTPEITGMSGTWVGARGETALDMEQIRKSDRTEQMVMAGINPAMKIVNTIGFGEVTADCYFFIGAIVLSAGFAGSGLASVAATSGLSRRSIFAVSRSLAT